MEKNIISVIAGCLFLVGAFAALIMCLNALWAGVFGDLDPVKAVSGFFGGVLVCFLCSWAGWKFIYQSQNR